MQWLLAQNLHQLAARHDPDREAAATSQVNAWLARTHWRGPQSVRADTRQWQVNGQGQRPGAGRSKQMEDGWSTEMRRSPLDGALGASATAGIQ